MWYVVQVVKGSKHYEPESQLGNRVLISDSSEMVISGRSLGTDGYRLEARRGSDSFVVRDFPGSPTREVITGGFAALAQQLGAIALALQT
jgi:hypothetical protein